MAHGLDFKRTSPREMSEKLRGERVRSRRRSLRTRNEQPDAAVPPLIRRWDTGIVWRQNWIKRTGQRDRDHLFLSPLNPSLVLTFQEHEKSRKIFLYGEQLHQSEGQEAKVHFGVNSLNPDELLVVMRPDAGRRSQLNPEGLVVDRVIEGQESLTELAVEANDIVMVVKIGQTNREVGIRGQRSKRKQAARLHAAIGSEVAKYREDRQQVQQQLLQENPVLRTLVQHTEVVPAVVDIPGAPMDCPQVLHTTDWTPVTDPDLSRDREETETDSNLGSMTRQERYEMMMRADPQVAHLDHTPQLEILYTFQIQAVDPLDRRVHGYQMPIHTKDGIGCRGQIELFATPVVKREKMGLDVGYIPGDRFFALRAVAPDMVITEALQSSSQVLEHTLLARKRQECTEAFSSGVFRDLKFTNDQLEALEVDKVYVGTMVDMETLRDDRIVSTTRGPRTLLEQAQNLAESRTWEQESVTMLENLNRGVEARTRDLADVGTDLNRNLEAYAARVVAIRAAFRAEQTQLAIQVHVLAQERSNLDKVPGWKRNLSDWIRAVVGELLVPIAEFLIGAYRQHITHNQEAGEKLLLFLAQRALSEDKRLLAIMRTKQAEFVVSCKEAQSFEKEVAAFSGQVQHQIAIVPDAIELPAVFTTLQTRAIQLQNDTQAPLATVVKAVSSSEDCGAYSRSLIADETKLSRTKAARKLKKIRRKKKKALQRKQAKQENMEIQLGTKQEKKDQPSLLSITTDIQNSRKCIQELEESRRQIEEVDTTMTRELNDEIRRRSQNVGFRFSESHDIHIDIIAAHAQLHIEQVDNRHLALHRLAEARRYLRESGLEELWGDEQFRNAVVEVMVQHRLQRGMSVEESLRALDFCIDSEAIEEIIEFLSETEKQVKGVESYTWTMQDNVRYQEYQELVAASQPLAIGGERPRVVGRRVAGLADIRLAGNDDEQIVRCWFLGGKTFILVNAASDPKHPHQLAVLNDQGTYIPSDTGRVFSGGERVLIDNQFALDTSMSARERVSPNPEQPSRLYWADIPERRIYTLRRTGSAVEFAEGIVDHAQAILVVDPIEHTVHIQPIDEAGRPIRNTQEVGDDNTIVTVSGMDVLVASTHNYLALARIPPEMDTTTMPLTFDEHNEQMVYTRILGWQPGYFMANNQLPFHYAGNGVVTVRAEDLSVVRTIDWNNLSEYFIFTNDVSRISSDPEGNQFLTIDLVELQRRRRDDVNGIELLYTNGEQYIFALNQAGNLIVGRRNQAGVEQSRQEPIFLFLDVPQLAAGIRNIKGQERIDGRQWAQILRSLNNLDTSGQARLLEHLQEPEGTTVENLFNEILEMIPVFVRQPAWGEIPREFRGRTTRLEDLRTPRFPTRP